MGKNKELKPAKRSISAPELRCIGNICFDDKGNVIVRISKESSPECAKAIADSILAGKEAKFEIVEELEEKKKTK